MIPFLLVVSSTVFSEQRKPLHQDELDSFIKDTPTFISAVKEKNLDFLLIKLFLHPQQVEEDPEIVEILKELNWTPYHYAYIFSRVIIGGFIRDMGGFGDEDLEFLKDQRKKWQESNEPEQEKLEMIRQLDRSIIDLTEIVARTKTIPKSELLLLWGNRDRLNDILMGKLPIGKQKMRALP